MKYALFTEKDSQLFDTTASRHLVRATPTMQNVKKILEARAGLERLAARQVEYNLMTRHCASVVDSPVVGAALLVSKLKNRLK